MKLQNKILSILVPLVVFPLIGLGWIAYDRLQKTAQQTVLDQMNTLMNQMTLNVQSALHTSNANLQLFSGSNLVKNYLLASSADRYGLYQLPLLSLFASYNNAYPEYYEIRILLPDGYEEARFAATTHKNLQEEEGTTLYFQEMSAHDNPVYTTFFQNPDNQENAFLVSQKLLFVDPSIEDRTVDEPSLRGYLAITVRLDFMKQQVKENRIGQHGFIFFTDHTGRILFHPDDRRENTILPSALFQHLTQPSEVGKLYNTNYQGSAFIFRSQQLHPRLFLFAALPEEELTSESNKLGGIVAAILFGTMILTIALLLFLLNFLLIRPIQKLEQAAEAIGGGDLQVRVDIQSHDEIGALANQFNKMTQDLQISHQQRELAIEKLQKADKLKDEFLANTSHELRTPLNGIIGLSESLIDGAGGPLNEIQHQNILMMTQSAKRLANLVNDILDSSKIRHQQLQLSFRPVDIKSVIEFVLVLSKPLIGQKHVKLINAIPNDLPLASADEDRIQQILLNLVGNAIKFTDEGSITLRAWHEETNLWVSVSDTGIGIPTEIQPQVFQAFEQADGSNVRQYGGTGLGLFITRQLIELHGGQIHVESQVNKGSNFYFNLKLATDQSLPRTPVRFKEHSPSETPETLPWESENTTSSTTLMESPTPIPEPTNDWDSIVSQPSRADTKHSFITEDPSLLDGEMKTILIIDDEPVNVHVLQNQLHLHEFPTLVAGDGFQALEMLKTDTPDLILLDLMMPRMNGYEVCQIIRETHLPTELPIIMLTAKNQLTDVVHGLQVGANDYLPKPFHKEELLARIRLHLRLSSLNKALAYANARLEQLLGSARQISRSVDKLGCLVVTSNAILRQLHPSTTPEIQISFWEEEHTNGPGYVQCWLPTSMNPQEMLFTQKTWQDTFPLTFLPQTEAESLTQELVAMPQGSFVAKGKLLVPIWNKKQLLGHITIQGIEESQFTEEHQEFIDVLSQYLAIALENRNVIGDLEQKVNLRTQELEEALQKLQRQHLQLQDTQGQLVHSEKMVSLGVLVAGVAHEVNNPINFIHSGVQNLQRRLNQLQNFLFELAGPDADEKILEAFRSRFAPIFQNLGSIIEGSQRISTIVRDLKSFSRLDEAEQKRASVVQGLKSTIGLVKMNYQQQVEFRCDFKAEPEIECWPAQLNQVFMNLIINGCQAIVSKYELQKATQPLPLHISTYIDDETLVIQFRDTGYGIPEEIRPKIFDPFFTTKPVGEGTGLGLSISFGIVEKHHGRITVDSREGEGTTFTVTLPLSSDRVPHRISA